VLHVLAASRSAITVRHWFEVNLEDASMEHGARIEIRGLRRHEHRGSESAAQLLTLDHALWRADLFDRLAEDAGSFAAAHYHPHFTDNEPCARVWDHRLSADPWGWLGDQVCSLGAGSGGWHVDREDAEELRGMADTVVATARQSSPAACGSAAECFRLTHDVKDAVRMMIAALRVPSLLDADWVAPWLRP
jgi:hypothetical protein